ncbi:MULTISPECIES: hypothetical protein [Neisseria]|nr:MULTISPECIES: hypothetical protein [Neisseria]
MPSEVLFCLSDGIPNIAASKIPLHRISHHSATSTQYRYLV